MKASPISWSLEEIAVYAGHQKSQEEQHIATHTQDLNTYVHILATITAPVLSYLTVSTLRRRAPAILTPEHIILLAERKQRVTTIAATIMGRKTIYALPRSDS